MQPVFKVDTIRSIEQAAIQQGISGDEMMKRAGKAAMAWVMELWSEVQSIVVFCGAGNNGGDGYVVARYALAEGLQVSVRYVGDIKQLKNEALNAYNACKEAGVEIKPFDPEEVIMPDVLVDALLGIGLQGRLRPEMLSAIDAMNEIPAPVLSLDTPSGLNVNDGAVLDTAVVADYTMTFLGLKPGMLTADGTDYCGDLCCYDLDLPTDIYKDAAPCACSVDFNDFDGALGLRSHNSHKGDFGHVLIIGGAPGMSGAPVISARGALRSGAGLVSIATHPEHAKWLNEKQPEIMCHAVKTKTQLKLLLDKASVIVIGPGLGQDTWAEMLFHEVMQSSLPVVVDADALHLLKKHQVTREQMILTPHPGEAAMLLGVTSQDIQANRFKAVDDIAKQYHATVVLKGCGTIIASEESDLWICNVGNPGMASGGMGDLLTGIIAGLIAQGVAWEIVATMGACLHGAAGDIVAEKGERGMLATDLLPVLRRLVNSV